MALPISLQSDSALILRPRLFDFNRLRGAYTSALPFSLQFTSALILWPRQCGFNRLRRSLRSVKEQIYVESQGLEKSDTKGFLSKSKFSKNRNTPTQNNISKQLLVEKISFQTERPGRNNARVARMCSLINYCEWTRVLLASL